MAIKKLEQLDFVRDGQRHYIALVGAGGKTSTMLELAQYFAQQSRRVLVYTSTKIMQPSSNYAASLEQVRALWNGRDYAIIGTPCPETGKLLPPELTLLQAAIAEADIVLVEADGARRLPCKVAAQWEPVLPAACDIVLGLVGLDCLNHRADQYCFRHELLPAPLLQDQQGLLTPQLVAELLTSPWGTAKDVGSRDYYVVLSKADVVTTRQLEELQGLLCQCGISQERIIVRGYGL